MPYADADFLLALTKEKDWLAIKARETLRKHKGDIWTSLTAITEVLLVGKRLDMDPERLVANIISICNLREEEKEIALVAAHLIKKQKMNVFDALHAAICGNDVIISSDSVFDKIGVKRIPLEK